jgi:hypothetical protein
VRSLTGVKAHVLQAFQGFLTPEPPDAFVGSRAIAILRHRMLARQLAEAGFIADADAWRGLAAKRREREIERFLGRHPEWRRRAHPGEAD